MQKEIYKHDNKAYCGGLFCHPNNLKITCTDCGIKVCNVCSVENKCIECYISNNVSDFVKEFDEMIKNIRKDLNKNKKDTNNIIIEKENKPYQVTV